MLLAAGVRLGPYEIAAPLGAGGMGEVYRARDSRLGRDVAIKVLPSTFAADGDRLQRFEQEARAAAALNHPNILAVYDIGAYEGAPYIVSELLEGTTLRDVLHGGALPVRKAIEYAVQIAQGLAAAHDKGIVHRDLKPENLFVTTEGPVKILDFGLVKLVGPAEAGHYVRPDALHDRSVRLQPDVTDSPTIGAPDTLPGMVLGTVGYMAPEQVRGAAADHRADVFAFGAVLYEMLSGRRAFSADTPADVMSAILREDPADLPVAERHIPPALARIVSRCLEKTPAARFQSTRDLAFALEALSTHSGLDALPAAPSGGHRSTVWRRAAIAGVAVLLAVGFAAIALTPDATTRDTATSRFQVDLPSALSLSGNPGTEFAQVAVSPDGRQFVFRTQDSRLVARSLESVAIRPIPGSEDAQSAPAFSPDGRFIAFMTTDKLRTVELATGSVRTLSGLPVIGGGIRYLAWGDEVIVMGFTGTGLFSVPADGGTPSPLTTLDEANGETGHLGPAFLPDGRHFVYVRAVDNSNRALYVGSLDSTDRKMLLDGGTTAAYASGYLLFGRERSLVAQRFDEKQLTLVGDPITIADDVRQDPLTGRAIFALSGSGLLVYQTRYARPSQLTWVDRQGQQISTIGDTAVYQTLALSRDDRRLAMGRVDPASGGVNVWVVDLATNATSRLTFGATRESDPAWSPDGTRLAYNAQRNNEDTLFEIPARGGAETVLLPAPRTRPSVDDWSRDGRFLLYHMTPSNEFMALPLTGDRTPFLVRQADKGRLDQGTFAPDGRWIAYNATESGRSEVYVSAFNGKGDKWQVSASGGAQPRWRADGRELFYLALNGTMMAIDVDVSGAAVTAATPRALFPTTLPVSDQVDQYAVTSDGKRFILIQPVPNAPAAQFTVVLNWQAALEGK